MKIYCYRNEEDGLKVYEAEVIEKTVIETKNHDYIPCTWERQLDASKLGQVIGYDANVVILKEANTEKAREILLGSAVENRDKKKEEYEKAAMLVEQLKNAELKEANNEV